MNRLILASVLLAAVAGLGFVQPATVQASGAPAPAGTYDVGGTVYAINYYYGYVVVVTQKGCFQAVYPDWNTSVTVHGVPGTVDDIAVGQGIRSSNSLATGHALTIDLR